MKKKEYKREEILKSQNNFLESLLKSLEDIKKGRVRTFKFER